MIAAKAVTTASAASILHSVGVASVGVGVGFRKQKYNAQKQNIIEDRMHLEGWRTQEMRKIDFLMTVGPSALAGVVVSGAGHFINHAAGHVAAAFTASHASATFSAAVHHPATFVHAMSDGASSQIHAVAEGLMGHATWLVPIDPVASNTPNS